MPKKFAMLGRTDAKRRRKEKLANSSAKIILDVLPLIGIAATVAMIPSSKRRKNAAIKMIRKEFEKQLAEARASERKELIAELKQTMKVETCSYYGSWKAIAEFVKKKED